MDTKFLSLNINQNPKTKKVERAQQEEQRKEKGTLMLAKSTLRTINRCSTIHLAIRRASGASTLELPVIDIGSFIDPEATPDLDEAARLVDGLRKYGALAIRDPRTDESRNQEFLNLMEEYFESRSQKFYAGEELEECFPHHGYQVGVTPELVEQARLHEDTIERFFKEDPVGDQENKQILFHPLRLTRLLTHFYFRIYFSSSLDVRPFFLSVLTTTDFSLIFVSQLHLNLLLETGSGDSFGGFKTLPTPIAISYPLKSSRRTLRTGRRRWIAGVIL